MWTVPSPAQSQPVPPRQGGVLQAFRNELDARFSEPDESRTYGIEPNRPTRILGVAITVANALPDALAADFVEPQEELGPPTAVVTEAATVGGNAEKLLSRLVHAMGWVIGLLVVAIIVLLFT